MKTELLDVSDTQKTLTIEIPTEIVDAEINRLARDLSKQARLPGFRPGKAPAGVVKQRFREQILHEVKHGLIPKAVDEALQARGIEPVASPDIRNVALHEGRPLTFTAAVETVPSFDPGDLSTISLTRLSAVVPGEALDHMLQRLRDQAAKVETVEGRPVSDGDTVVANLSRVDADGGSDRHDGVNLQVGAPGNPPGFDVHLVGMAKGDHKTFPLQFPADYAVKELAGTEVTYTVEIVELRHRILPDLDDEFAKDLPGDFESLDALRARIQADLQAEAAEESRRHLRTDLFTQLAARMTFPAPPSLVEREIDRRLEEFARQLVRQNLDPRETGIDWAQFREAQRAPAEMAVASALVLDEVARREQLTVSAADVDKEIETLAVRAGRTPTALRAQLEKEGGAARLYAGLRREKAVDLVLSRARMVEESRPTTGDA
jgi:trigger factor